MLYKALTSFSGIIYMAAGEVREISNLAVAKDLIKAGYIEAVKKEEAEKPIKVERKPRRKPAK